ncbi:MAG: hypothetical protein QNK11_03660 [Legionella sp.]|nr:hypothetical protein [Legionella sp.]
MAFKVVSDEFTTDEAFILDALKRNFDVIQLLSDETAKMFRDTYFSEQNNEIKQEQEDKMDLLAAVKQDALMLQSPQIYALENKAFKEICSAIKEEITSMIPDQALLDTICSNLSKTKEKTLRATYASKQKDENFEEIEEIEDKETILELAEQNDPGSEVFLASKFIDVMSAFWNLLNNSEALNSMEFDVFGSALYNEHADDLDIAVSGMHQSEEAFLLDTLKGLLYFNNAEIKAHYQKQNPAKHVIKVRWRCVDIDFVICKGTLQELLDEVDFGISAVALNVRTGKLNQSSLNLHQQERAEHIVDTVKEPNVTFTEDPIRVLRAVYILGICPDYSLSERCLTEINRLFDGEKNLFTDNKQIHFENIYRQIDRIFKAFSLYNYQYGHLGQLFLLKYSEMFYKRIIPALIKYLNNQPNSDSKKFVYKHDLSYLGGQEKYYINQRASFFACSEKEEEQTSKIVSDDNRLNA